MVPHSFLDTIKACDFIHSPGTCMAFHMHDNQTFIDWRNNRILLCSRAGERASIAYGESEGEGITDKLLKILFITDRLSLTHFKALITADKKEE